MVVSPVQAGERASMEQVVTELPSENALGKGVFDSVVVANWAERFTQGIVIGKEPYRVVCDAVPNRYTLCLNEGSELLEELRKLPSFKVEEGDGREVYVEIGTQEDFSRVLNLLRENPEAVVYFTPVLRDREHGREIIFTEEITAAFKKGTSFRTIEEFANEYGVNLAPCEDWIPDEEAHCIVPHAIWPKTYEVYDAMRNDVRLEFAHPNCIEEAEKF